MDGHMTSQADIERLIAQRSWFTPMPPDFVPAYRLQRQREFTMLAARWWFLLVLAYVALFAATALFHHRALHGGDLRVYALTEVLGVCAGAIGLLLARCKAMRERADQWVPALYGLIVAAKIVSAMAVADAALASNQIYMTLLVIVIGMLALRLSLSAAVLGCVLGAFGFVGWQWLHPDSALMPTFLAQYVMTSGVCVFVAVTREDNDRIAFLQATLLDYRGREVKRLNDELQALAWLDPLTGLSNRRRFETMLEREWQHGTEAARAMALLMIDVDHFKAYNDRYGHPAGDDCLREVAALIARRVAASAGLAARYGGEEFAVLLPRSGAGSAVALAQQLIEDLRQRALPHAASPTAPQVTISIGIAEGGEAGAPDSPRALLQAADAALYRAKHSGRNTCCRAGA